MHCARGAGNEKARNKKGNKKGNNKKKQETKKKKTKRETTKRKKNDEPIIDFHAVVSLTVGIRTTITISFFFGNSWKDYIIQEFEEVRECVISILEVHKNRP